MIHCCLAVVVAAWFSRLYADTQCLRSFFPCQLYSNPTLVCKCTWYVTGVSTLVYQMYLGWARRQTTCKVGCTVLTSVYLLAQSTQDSSPGANHGSHLLLVVNQCPIVIQLTRTASQALGIGANTYFYAGTGHQGSFNSDGMCPPKPPAL